MHLLEVNNRCRFPQTGVAVEPAKGLSDSQLTSSLILLVTGGAASGVSTSKYERVERGGGQQK